MKTSIVLALAALVSLCGCSSHLTVNVENLDRAYWVSPRPLAVQHAPELFDAYARTSYPWYMSDIRARVSAIIDEANKQGAVHLSAGALAGLKRDVPAQIARDFAVFRAAIAQGVQDYLKTFEVDSNPDASDRQRLAVIHRFRAANELMRTTEDKVRQLLLAFGPEKAAEIATKIVAAVDPGSALRSDSSLSLVLAAPDEFWHGPSDGVEAHTYFGNSDIAFKAVDALSTNFTLKGVKLDASQAIAASINMTRVAVQTMASMYGVVPPRSAATGVDSTQMLAYQPDISPLKLKAAAELTIKELRTGRVGLLDALVARSPALSDTDASKRGAAVDALMKDYGALFTAPAGK